jgi:hypothetical protein
MKLKNSSLKSKIGSHYLMIISSLLLCIVFLPNFLWAQVAGNLSTEPNIAILSNSPVYVGKTLKLRVTGGNHYQWSGPNNFTSGLKFIEIQNISTNYAGTYYCTVTDDTWNTTVVLSMNVSILSKSVTNITCDPFICAYSNLYLSTSTGGTGATYLWQDLTTGTWTSS